MNHGGHSTTMEDLDDHMLTQILFRLPSYVTVLACSPVSKRWYSIISEPSFPNIFAKHKKKTTTVLMGSGSDFDESLWTIVHIKVTNINRFITESIFGSPKLSLEFLPCNTFAIKATFKDLVLCSCYEHNTSRDRPVYYIANPLTKQWIALPPCGPCPLYMYRTTKAALICQSPYNNTQHYKFRVVEARYPWDRNREFINTFDLVVYCSEIGKWNEIKLSLPRETGLLRVDDVEPQTVVCNGIIYVKSGLCLVGLDPFDVNDTCDTTLEARVMPPLPEFGYLLESSGHLLLVHSPETMHKKDGTDIEAEMVVWKLDLNQATPMWETTFEGFCKGTGNKPKSRSNPRFGISNNPIEMAVHPYNDKLIYMYLSSEKRFVLCNTRTGCIETLKNSSNYSVPSWESLHRLELQWRPTLVPALCRTELATTTASSR